MNRRRIIYVLLAIGVVGTVIWMRVGGGSNTPAYVPATVTRGTVLNIVSVTGHAEPQTRIDLAFPVGGRVSALPVEEGMQVLRGTVVAVLDGAIEESTLREAQTRVTRERALLNDLTAPLRTEERALKETSVANATQSLERADETARAAIARAFVYADSAIHEKADTLFSNTTGTPKIGINFTYGSTIYVIQSDFATEQRINEKRAHIESLLANMSARAQDTSVSTDRALEETSADLMYIKDFLTDLAFVVNQYTADSSTNQTVYSSFQTSVGTARTSVNTALSEITSARTGYSTAAAALSLAQHDLELSEAGASQDSISAQRASLASALAAVGTAAERAQNNVLTVPFGGTLSRIDTKVGEIVGPYEPVAELITEGALMVEAYIPEADIARVQLGNKAAVTFDAFDKSSVFEAEVVRIALSETVREGVPTYKTTLRLISNIEDIAVRPGMTADIDIHTDRQENVLYIPVRSVLREGTRTYVRVYENGEFKEKDITIGLRGSEGTVEVVSGLQEGEEIVLYIEEA